MSKVRGDDDLFSLMDEMSSSLGYGGDEQKTSSTNKNKQTSKGSTASSSVRRRIRLVSEIQGYPSNTPQTAGSRSIWNPYVASPISKQYSSPCWWFPLTNPCTEVFRRRAYEKFKLKFRDLFVIIQSNQNQYHPNNQAKKKSGANNDFEVSKLWGDVSASQILERWHFGIKLLEMDKIRKNNQSSSNYNRLPPLSTPSPSSSTNLIRSNLVLGRENCVLMDPILVASGSYSGDGGGNPNNTNGNTDLLRKHNQQIEQINASILKSELIFEWKRTWRRKVKGKTQEEKLDHFLSSAKFQKKVTKLARDVRNVATEVEGQFWNELRKQSSQEEYRTVKSTASNKQQEQGNTNKKHKKQKSKHVPKLTLRDDGSICLTHLGLSFTINEEHYRKLQVLFDRFQSNSLDSRTHNENFICATFSLLARYDMLQGAGLQSSLHGAVFDVLLQRFDCRMECFASPLNCRYERYCSAFVDTDSPFGSLGSFFDFDFKAHLSDKDGGCFQANPPFAADFIHAMHHTMEKALGDVGTKPLMFIVFVPAWTETEGWKALEGSKRYLTKHVLLSQSSHYYCEGTQHRRKDRYRVASFDSSVFFLQNEAAKQKWPVTEDAIDELRSAFETNPEEEKDDDNNSNRQQIAAVPATRANTVAINTFKQGENNFSKVKSRTTSTEDVTSGNNNNKTSSSQKVPAKQKQHSKGVNSMSNKKKRKLISDESSGGNKDQLSILSSLGLMSDKKEGEDPQDGKLNKVKTFSTKKKKRKNKKRNQQDE